LYREELTVATAKELEEVLGISARTIENWSRARDDKYLLAKFLKSFSVFDLKQRIKDIVDSENILILNKKIFLEDFQQNFSKFFNDKVIHTEINWTAHLERIKLKSYDMIIEGEKNIYIIEEIAQMRSKKMLQKKCNSLYSSITKVYDDASLKDKALAEKAKDKNIIFVYIVPSKSANTGKEIDIGATDYKVMVIDIDVIAEKIYNKGKVLLKF